MDGVFNNTLQVTSIGGAVAVIVNESNLIICLDVPSSLGFGVNGIYSVFATLHSDNGQNVSTGSYIFSKFTIVCHCVTDCLYYNILIHNIAILQFVLLYEQG